MRRRLLVVDDDEAIRLVAGLALERVGGFEVETVAGGAAAIEVLADGGYDAVLLDVMMPGLDGPTTLAGLRAQPASAQVPVAFVTAKLQPDEIAGLESLDVVGVLGKPFDPMTLAAQVRTLFGWDVGQGPT